MLEILQIVGAALVLTAFVGLQIKRIDSTSDAYLMMNAAGSALLAVLALIGQQWGFLLLEGTWAAVSVAGLLARRREPPPETADAGTASGGPQRPSTSR